MKATFNVASSWACATRRNASSAPRVSSVACGCIMDKVIINFRRDPEAAWGNDIKAVRKQQMQEEDGTKSFLHGYNVSGSKGSRAFLSPKSESSMRLSPKSGSMPNLHSWT